MSELWDSVLQDIQGKIAASHYQRWFGSVRCVGFEGGVLQLQVPDAFHRGWLTDYYLDLIRDAAEQRTGGTCQQIEFQVSPEKAETAVEAPEPPAGSHPLHHHLSAHPTRPLVTSVVAAPLGEPLNPRYSFETFVVGANNQLAVAACKAVGDMPGGHYNPLFLYGGVGLGKTHLLNAIGLAIRERFPHLRILYVQSERFMNEVINAIRFDKAADLRRKYRDGCDVLLMDDIQFIAGKERTQEEFFHTFNCLHGAQKQIVVTSDRFPKDIPDLDDRIRSRFEWGLIADMQAPDLETRIAILRKKAEASGVALGDEVSIFLAQQFRSNVRELEGSLIRLAAYSALHKAEITIDFAREHLKDILKESTSTSTVEAIQKLVADYYQIKLADMKSARRMQHLARPRQIAMYLVKKHLDTSYPEIGRKFGGKDHSTVIHACKKIGGAIPQDAKLRDEIEFIEKSLAQ